MAVRGKRINIGKAPGRIRSLVSRLGLALISLTIGSGCTAPQKHDVAENQLFRLAIPSTAKVDEAMRSRIIRHRFVSVDFQMLMGSKEARKSPTADGSTLILNLFEDAVFKAVRDRWQFRSGKSFTWLGHIDRVEDSQVTLAVEDEVMAGNIRLRDRQYQVRYAGDGTHVIYEIDPRAFPPDSEPARVPGGR